MLFNHNARAFCRDCKQNCIPVHREVRVGHSVSSTVIGIDAKKFIDTDDSIIRLRCPLCGSYKLTSKPSVSDEEMNLISGNAMLVRVMHNAPKNYPVLVIDSVSAYDAFPEAL